MEVNEIKDRKFNSYDGVLQFVQAFENENFVQLNKVYAKKLSSSCVQNKYPEKMNTVNKSLVYYNLTYMCANGGRYKFNGTHKRKSSTSKLGCSMFIRFRLSADGQELKIAAFSLTHNHIVNEEVFRLLPKQRRLNQEQKQEAEKFIKLKCNKKMIKNYIKTNMGKTVTLKDISNIKLNKNLHDKNALLETVNFLKMDPEAEIEVLVNEDNELEGLYFQNKYMKNSFNSYPEVLLSDATYKLNNLRIPLYILLVINGNGNGEVAATFLLVNENENSLTHMIQLFKNSNCWEKTVTIITDKDLKERHVFEKEFPNSKLILCLFHTLKTFKTTITTQKMNISSMERENCLKILQNLAYSKDEKEYEVNYAKFLDLKLEKIIEYYNNNWHSIREQWVEGLKRQNLTYNVTTTNHLESLNQKIKQVVAKMSDLKSFYEDFLILLETIRDEYRSKAANMALKKVVHQYNDTSVEAKYINLLTPYAFSFVEKNLKIYKKDKSDNKWLTTLQECNCNFRQNMKLPCCHIFHQRSIFDMDLYDSNLVDERYKKVNYIAHNTTTMSVQSATSLPNNIFIKSIKNSKPLSNNEKYRRTMDLCQQIASCSSECGTLKYKKMIEQLHIFMNLVKKGKDVMVVEDFNDSTNCILESTATGDNDRGAEVTGAIEKSEDKIVNKITSDKDLTKCPLHPNTFEEVKIKTTTVQDIHEIVVAEQVETADNEKDDLSNMSMTSGFEYHTLIPSDLIKREEDVITEVETNGYLTPALRDHTYNATDNGSIDKSNATDNGSIDKSMNVFDGNKYSYLENIKYKHLKMIRIGRPKGADLTVIGLKKKKKINR